MIKIRDKYESWCEYNNICDCSIAWKILFFVRNKWKWYYEKMSRDLILIFFSGFLPTFNDIIVYGINAQCYFLFSDLSCSSAITINTSLWQLNTRRLKVSLITWKNVTMKWRYVRGVYLYKIEIYFGSIFQKCPVNVLTFFISMR